MKLKVFTAFSGYDSQCLALDRLSHDFPGFEYELVGWSEIDKYAIQAHNALYPEAADKNFGDISKINWGGQIPDFELFTYSFPCFVAGTLVETESGFKPIEEVKIGEKVLTHTGRYEPVLKTMNRAYDKELYTIKTMCAEPIHCTDGHPFYVRLRSRVGHKRVRVFGEPQWVKAKDLTKDHFVGVKVDDSECMPEWSGITATRWHINRNDLSEKTPTRAFWYLMGRYVGDGWLRKNKLSKGIVICCGGRNEDALMSALAELGFRYTRSKERTVAKYHICKKELYEFVKRFGEYAHGKCVDAETLRLPKELLRSFIDGVIDSDGYKTKTGYIKITTTSRILAYGLVKCINKAYQRPASLHFTKRPPKCVIEGHTCNQRDTFEVVFKLQRNKQDKAFYEDGYVWYPINEITHEKKCVDAYNFEVATDNSYTANGVIVHNCQDISNAGLQKGFAEGSGSRSSLLWECAKAIEAKKPKFLLMENVKALIQKKFMPDFIKWQMWLEGQGYRNFWQVLNAKNYGVPQNRERVFMVSILDPNAEFEFPKPFELERRLKDVLEDNVDESYYLKQQQVDNIIAHCDRKVAEGCGFKTQFVDPQQNSSSGGGGIVTQSQQNMAIEKPTRVLRLNSSQDGVVVDSNSIANCHTAGHGNQPKVLLSVNENETESGINCHA